MPTKLVGCRACAGRPARDEFRRWIGTAAAAGGVGADMPAFVFRAGSRDHTKFRLNVGAMLRQGAASMEAEELGAGPIAPGAVRTVNPSRTSNVEGLDRSDGIEPVSLAQPGPADGANNVTTNGTCGGDASLVRPDARLVRAVAAALIALSALALAGCESTGGMGAVGLGVAEVTPATRETSTNIASLSDVVSRNPRDAEAYNTRGAAYARTGNFDDAIGDFSKAVQIDPKSASAYTNRALAYRQTNHNDLALADFNRALESNPNHAPAYLGRANLLRGQGNYAEAMADLDQAIKLNPEGGQGAQAFHARGLIHQRQGDHVRAIADFDNAIDRDPFAAAPYQARAQSLMAQGKYPQAIEDLNAALNVDTKNAEAWANLGMAYEKSGNPIKARESYSHAKAIDPANRLASDGLSRMGS